MSKESFLSIGDVARQLGKSISLVRILEGRGDLRAIRLPDGTRIFRQRTVERYIERQREDADGPQAA